MKNKTQVFESYEDFYNREDKSINGVSEEFAKKHPNFEGDNETNVGCWDSDGCRNCVDCINCGFCARCIKCIKCVHRQDLVGYVFNRERLC